MTECIYACIFCKRKTIRPQVQVRHAGRIIFSVTFSLLSGSHLFLLPFKEMTVVAVTANCTVFVRTIKDQK